MKLQHQIGGHPNVTSDESGTLVIKPASPREIAFYQLLHSTPPPPKLSAIPPFLPRFYGTLKIQSPDGASESSTIDSQPECIILSNLSAPYTHPCIMDIKLGTTLYDASDALLSEEKIRKMQEKMKVRSSVKTGAAITGFQTWDVEKGGFTLLSREECGKLKPEELAGAFAKFVPCSEPNTVSHEGPPADSSSPYAPSLSTSTHRQSLLRTLRALLQTLSNLHALLSRLEIRFIGASLLIIYEGDPFKLDAAWATVDAGTSRGDGLEDDEFSREDDSSDEEQDVELDGLADAADAERRNGKSFFSHVFGKFGADAYEGAQGFGLLDGSPPPSPRRRPSNHMHSASQRRNEHQDMDNEEEDDERIADSDAHERLLRPFTLRLIDFAHTRLLDGEGPDEGVLLGLKTVMELVRARIGDLERVAEQVEGERAASMVQHEEKTDEMKIDDES
ncbi:hypothetical protein NCC49_002882 [Naganishia albida]|nr:hypothetical protein NCC49_002882 [Naganishia albida]